MKWTNEYILRNLEIYQQAKDLIPTISQYERGEVTSSSMRFLGLKQFSDFFDFQKSQNDLGWSLTDATSYRELKNLIASNTQNERFKSQILNKSEKSFTNLLTEDTKTWDRLLNGRWIRKPGWSQITGRKQYGRRSEDLMSGLDTCLVPIVNWMISKGITTSNLRDDSYESFDRQSKYQSKLKWYCGVELDLDELPIREIEISNKVLESVCDFLINDNFDFRKLNSDFLIDNLNQKIRKLMLPPKGTTLKCIDSLVDTTGSILTEGQSYKVVDSSIFGGSVKVFIENDQKKWSYYEYKYFEDMSIRRDDIFRQLGL
jgi:hypothetical protein